MAGQRIHRRRPNATPRQQVEYGLENIPADRMVSVSLRDLMYVHQTLQEFSSFFHQPLHWETLGDVQAFIGNTEDGGFHCLHQSLYSKMRDMIPAELQAEFDGGFLDNPSSPFYHAPKDAIYDDDPGA
jgi:hypothetical protein